VPGTPGTPGAPGPGFTGVVYSDWEAITNFSGGGYALNTCESNGILKENDKLLNAAYLNGIILAYQKDYADNIYSIPRSDSFQRYQIFILAGSKQLWVTFSQTSPSYTKPEDCELPAKTTAFKAPNVYRYVLIPLPSAKSKGISSSLTTPLERAKAWYGLNDLSYASVKQRFDLKD